MSRAPAPADGEARLRRGIEELADQLCLAVDGNFDFAVRSSTADETLEKLSMLTNFVLDTARRGMTALRRHNESLAELDRAKTVFFSNASHELRTPLTLILGPLEEALAKSPPALPEPALRSAHRNAVRLLKLVNALLDFSRIEAGGMRAQYQPTDLAALTADIAAMYRPSIESAGLEFRVACPPLAEPVYVDREMWEKIVLNLLSNAFKFTFAGAIEVALKSDAQNAVLEVRDSGVGIAAGELPRVFERFHRVEGVRARTHEGFGIGLAMIQELAQLHGGAVSAQSEHGKGSTFRVSVPLGTAHLPAERIVRAAAAAADSRARTAYRLEAESWRGGDPAGDPGGAAAPARAAADEPASLLVVDDNADMRAYVSRILGERWTIATAADGAEALAAVRARRPDLVVSDLMMPVLSGQDLLRALRADAATCDIPVILLTARAGDDAMVEGLELGADDYLVKPFSAHELVARVRTHLKLSRARADAVTIGRIGALLNSRLEPQEVVQLLTDEATRLCGAQFGAFFYNMLDDKGERYMLYTLAGAPREAALFAPTFAGERIIRLDDVTRDPRYGKSAPPGVRSYLAVPVVSRSGEVLGGLFFGHGEPGVFTERAERLLAAVAHHAAVAIDNARVYKSEREARAQAQAAGRAKDEFLAMLGHELRNPLAPIVTALDIMRLRGDQHSRNEQAIIRRQVDHLVRLVDDLLDVSRVARGKIELHREPLEIAAVVEKALEMARGALEAKRHRVSVEVPAQGLRVLADRERMAQVLCNILLNAAKFTNAGGHIALSAGAASAQAVVRVRDDGIGIAPEQLSSIFEMFVQSKQSLDRAEGGMGLGLAIARNLVALHGGSIEARSDGPGRGSEFIVRLPLHEGASVGAEQPAPPAPAPAPQPRSLRILLVDDNVDAALSLAQAMRYMGHRVEVRHDGPSALAAAAELRPDAVLLDIGLPLMDGYEVARRLREQPGTRDARLVAVTGYGQQAHRDRAHAAGFDEHLVKPLELKALEALLARVDAAEVDAR